MLKNRYNSRVERFFCPRFMRQYEVWKTCRKGHGIMISKNPWEMCSGPLNTILLLEVKTQHGFPSVILKQFLCFSD